MTKKKLTYAEARKELEEIAQRLESEELNIDELEELVKRGKELVKFCQDGLRNIEDRLESNS